jgi:hypothetical protein
MHSEEPENAGNSGVSLEEATGAVAHAWHAKDGSDLWCEYGRPRGVVTPIIHAALGPDNAANIVMDYQFRVMLGIRTWCGKPVTPTRGARAFEEVANRFALPGDVADEGDARYQDFISEGLRELYPEFREAEDQGKE